MAQQLNMAGMGSVGGPVGGPHLMNSGSSDHTKNLNTYIYDYFLKNGHFELARAVHNTLAVNTTMDNTNADIKRSPRRDVNGVSDGMDDDSKDNVHKIPDDLPRPKLPPTGNDNSFLLDWWCQFWEMWSARRGRNQGAAHAYLQHSHASIPDTFTGALLTSTQSKNRFQREQQQQQMIRQQMDPQMINANMAGYRMIPQNAIMQNELQRKALVNNQRNGGPQLQQASNIRQQQMLQQSGQMQREGSAMGVGQDRPQSPGGSIDNAPSPKRPRIEGNGFAGPMGPGPAGRGQPQGMQGQGIPNVAGLPQGSPMNGQQNPDMSEYYPQQRMPPGIGGPPNPNGGGNHALQDYQMQLMLLEQQNKKRLLMARQEQDNSGGMGHPSGPGGPGQAIPPGFAQGMSPQARPGPSPNPSDQMRRGTPKMGQSPLPDGTMPQQGSPAPNFDHNPIPQGVHPQFYNQQMKAQQEGMQMAANGPLMRPPNSNPAFGTGPVTAENLPRMRQQVSMQQNGINFAGGPPNMMHQPQPGQQGQQPPNMGTPQPGSMPPPPAPPAVGEATRTQSPSPAQTPNQPPTPSQTNKANPTKKKGAAKDNKKPANKKGSGATGPTPASESQELHTPSTPVTPNQQQKNGTGSQQQPTANASQPPATAAPPQPPQPDANAGAPFSDLGTADLDLGLNFAPLDNSDVLQDFDFDSFMHDNNDPGFAFDANFNFNPEGLEAGTGE